VLDRRISWPLSAPDTLCMCRVRPETFRCSRSTTPFHNRSPIISAAALYWSALSLPCLDSELWTLDSGLWTSSTQLD
jgi:hypothetical protein